MFLIVLNCNQNQSDIKNVLIPNLKHFVRYNYEIKRVSK